jgi:hypothetical protein
MFRLGLVDTLIIHANIKGFGLTPLSGDRRGYTLQHFKMADSKKLSFSKSPILKKNCENFMDWSFGY